MGKNIDTFETSDISLAAYLHCSGINLEFIDRNNPRHCIFVFKSPKAELLTEWQSGKARVNVLAYRNSYESLKRQIWENHDHGKPTS